MEESKVCHEFAERGRCRFGERCRFEHVGSPPKKPRSKTKKKSHKGRREPQRDSANHIAEFFAQYPTYQYNPARSFMDEFYAMCDFFCWEKGSKESEESEERKQARELLRNAMVKQFNNLYGTDVDDLEAWQSLCRALELDPIPSKLRTCRTAIKGVYVNICDLLDAPMLGKPTLFSTEVELALYTKSTGKTFPRDNIHSGSLLRYLLRQILNPGTVPRGRRR